MVLGMSIPLCEEQFFRVDKRPLQLWAEAARQVVSSLNRILQKSKTKEKIVTTMAISRLCSWVSPDCATYVRIQSPKTPGETAMLIAEYLRTHRERRQKYWMNEEHGRKESQDSRSGYVRSHEKSGEKDSYRSDSNQYVLHARKRVIKLMNAQRRRKMDRNINRYKSGRL